MDGMHGGNMPGMSMSPPPSNDTAGHMMMGHDAMMHMTFFWGKNALILFSGWPGSHSGMYFLALLLVFVCAVLVEWLSHCNLIKENRDGSGRVVAGVLRTVMHMGRVGLAYLVMLALMSFNGGVFLVAVLGHAVGFLFFASGVFKKSTTPVLGKTSDLPPMNC